jgi:hypothetical protein
MREMQLLTPQRLTEWSGRGSNPRPPACKAEGGESAPRNGRNASNSSGSTTGSVSVSLVSSRNVSRTYPGESGETLTRMPLGVRRFLNDLVRTDVAICDGEAA